eukprot:m51a1_g6208 hypothetical protein (537) ;mRNA; r:147381-150992
MALCISVLAISSFPGLFVLNTATRDATHAAARMYLDASSAGLAAALRNVVEEPGSAVVALARDVGSGVVDVRESWRLLLAYAAVYNAGSFGVSTLGQPVVRMSAADAAIYDQGRPGHRGVIATIDPGRFNDSLVHTYFVDSYNAEELPAVQYDAEEVPPVSSAKTAAVEATTARALSTSGLVWSESYVSTQSNLSRLEAVAMIATHTADGRVALAYLLMTLDVVGSALARVGGVGEVAVVLDAGGVLATSTGVPVTTADGRRIPAAEFPEQMVRSICLALGDVSGVRGPVYTHVSVASGRALSVRAERFVPHEGLEWVIAVAVEDGTFMGRGRCLQRIAQLDLHGAQSIAESRRVGRACALSHELATVRSSTELMLRSLWSFQCYVPPSVVRGLVNGTLRAELGMRPFVALLTEYLDAMTSVVSSCGGTVDKFIDGGFMAFWNAPDPVKGHHSDRLNYTLLGHMVNEGARLEPLNQTYDTEIIVSDSVLCETQGHFLCRPLGLVQTSGRDPIRVHELISFQQDASPQVHVRSNEFM